jgi:hypothetical protein
MDCSLGTEASPFVLRGKTAGPFERLMWCAAPVAGCAAKIPPPTDKDLLCRSHRPPFPRLFACYTYSSSRPRTQTNRLLFNLARSSTHTHLRGYNFAIQIQHHRERARWSLFTLPTAQSTLSLLSLFSLGEVICDLVLLLGESETRPLCPSLQATHTSVDANPAEWIKGRTTEI